LFIAEFADRFAPKIIAELRGKLDADGKSPFWEGLGRHFFAMEYKTADYLTGIGQKSFVAELMPRHPVYVNLLPEAARSVIGEVHDDTKPARAMLEQEGFRYEGYIDIFDAGPTVECFRDNILAVRGSRVFPVEIGDGDPVPDTLSHNVIWLVTNRKFESYRALLVQASARVDRFPLLPYAAAQLGVAEGDLVRAVHPRVDGPACRHRTRARRYGQFRWHPGADAQLCRPCPRQSRRRATRATDRPSTRSSIARTCQDARACGPRLCAGGAASARATVSSRVARARFFGRRPRNHCASGA
jgi:hypothetical protein